MKKTIYFLIAVLFVACSGSNMNSKYEKTIRDYVLKGQSGIDFKVLEMSEQGTVTVADSIAYLTNDFRKRQFDLRKHAVRQVSICKSAYLCVLFQRDNQKEELTSKSLGLRHK